MKFKEVLEPSEEGGYTVFVPALLGCTAKARPSGVDARGVSHPEAVGQYVCVLWVEQPARHPERP